MKTKERIEKLEQELKTLKLEEKLKRLKAKERKNKGQRKKSKTSKPLRFYQKPLSVSPVNFLILTVCLLGVGAISGLMNQALGWALGGFALIAIIAKGIDFYEEKIKK